MGGGLLWWVVGRWEVVVVVEGLCGGLGGGDVA